MPSPLHALFLPSFLRQSQTPTFHLSDQRSNQLEQHHHPSLKGLSVYRIVCHMIAVLSSFLEGTEFIYTTNTNADS